MKNKKVNSAIERGSISTTATKQARTLLIFLVVAGYILTFFTAASGTAHFSALQIMIGVLFGVVYIILGMFDIEILRRFPVNARNAIYFSFAIALVFGIGWTLGPGGTWLIGIPLATRCGVYGYIGTPNPA